MSEQSSDSPPQPDKDTARVHAPLRRPLRARLRRMLRALLLMSAGALILFWGYTLHVIGEHAGSGAGVAEWAPAFPMTLILLLLTLPAFIIGLFGRPLIFGALVATASAIVNAWVWREILAGLAG